MEARMFSLLRKKTEMVAEADALPGRVRPIPTASTHFVSGRPAPDTPAQVYTISFVGGRRPQQKTQVPF